MSAAEGAAPPEQIRVGDLDIAVWPQSQAFACDDNENTVFSTRFPDAARYHDRLVATIMARADDPELRKKFGQAHGGVKVYGVSTWDCPAARLVDLRAQALARRVLKTPSVAVDNSWANVYRAGDYIMPHSHVRALASLVYIVDPGEETGETSLSGRFAFVDPRYGQCCRIEPGRMTNPVTPPMEAGRMLIFPGQLLHFVTPYQGTRPRITMSWNVNRERLPGSRMAEIEAALASERARTGAKA